MQKGQIIGGNWLEAITCSGADMVLPKLPPDRNPYECPNCGQFKFACESVCEFCVASIGLDKP